MEPSAKWKGLQAADDGLNTRTGAASITDTDFTDYPPFTQLDNGQQMGENTNMFWLYDTGTFPLNNLIDDWTICYTAVANPDLSLSNIGVFTLNIDEPTYTTDNADNNGIMFYNSCGYRRIINNIPSDPWGTPLLLASFRFYCPPYNNSKYVWTPNADGARSNQGYIDFYSKCNVEGYAAPYKTFGIKSMFLEIRVVPYRAGDIPLPLLDYSLKAYMALTDAAREANPIGYAYARVWRRGNTNGTYTYYGAGNYDINAAITVPFSGNGYSNIGAYFNNIFLKDENPELYFPLFGNASGKRNPTNIRYNKQENKADIFYGYNKIDNRIVTSDTELERDYIFTMSGTEENAEYLRKSCAAYGLFFCDDINTSDNKNLAGSELEANNGRWLHNDMYLGIIEESGYTEGRYTRGVLNGMQAQFTWKDSTESNYNPAYPPVPENDYNTETVFNTVSGISTMTQRYALTAGAVKNLGTALWSISSELIDDGGGGTDYSELNQKILDTFLTNNPIDCIVSLRKFPFEISKDDSTLVKLGKYETIVGGYTVSQTIDIFEFRMRKKVLPLFNDSFLDYEPYTHFELYVPFCGTVSVEPADILNRSLSVRLAVDYSTGTCTAYILSDSLVIKTISGQIAIDIPVSGIQSVTAASQINNAIAQASTAHKQERSATLGNVSVGGAVQFMLNPVKTIESAGIAENAAQRADYELQHQTIQPHLIGSASSAAGWLIDFSCRLLIYYPTGEVLYNTDPPSFNPLKLLEYGHTVGFACCNTGTLSSFSGLTVAVKADLNNIKTNGLTARPATLQELQMLEDALNEGVIL